MRGELPQLHLISGVEIPDLIPDYRSTNLEEDWRKFYEEITRRFPEEKDDEKKGKDNGKKEDGDEKEDKGSTTKGDEREKQDTTESSIIKGKKRKDRVIAVAAFMGGFNALTVCAIVTFFIWYKSYVKKQKQKQVSSQAADEQASESSSTIPGAPSPVAASPARALGATPKAASSPKPVEQQSVKGFPGVSSGPPKAPAPAAPEQFVPEGIVPDPAPPPDSLDVKF
ncbi:unnamed protein product [Cylicostephanus goldi]|uniref:Uncharacterized protein n=1 Tax=Cylicostephanus goldi TaxID=71465 RepID=A0A3P6R2L4_CYLGO|nr:unnamed protein product [Cylicostephanus goldi]